MKKFNLIIFFLENVMSSMISTVDETEIMNEIAKEIYCDQPHNKAIELLKKKLKEIKFFKKDNKVYKVIQENENIFILNMDDDYAQKIPESAIHIFENECSQC